jgi:hypothetical protein
MTGLGKSSSAGHRDEYFGGFLNGLKHGEGTRLWKDGSQYVGGWLQGKMSGRGEFIKANGDKYKGEYLNGLEHGSGTQTKKNGSYEGNWVKGKKIDHEKYTFIKR